MMALQITLLLFARLSVEAFILQQDITESDAVQALIVYNGGWWGTWHQPEFCPKGSFANGYSMKIEWDQGGGDDTSLNSIKLRCIFEDGSFAGEVASGQGPWGTWHPLHICPFIKGELNLLTSFALKVEPDQGGGDDTGVNSIKFACRSTRIGSNDILLNSGDEGPFGNYGSWSESCRPGSFICGLRTKIEDEQGNGDDTGLDDVQFYCCHGTCLSPSSNLNCNYKHTLPLNYPKPLWICGVGKIDQNNKFRHIESLSDQAYKVQEKYWLRTDGQRDTQNVQTNNLHQNGWIKGERFLERDLDLINCMQNLASVNSIRQARTPVMKLEYVPLFCIGLVEAFLLTPNEERKIVKVLIADNGGWWGEWHPPQFCAEGAYATGYTMKLECDQHGQDDTSLNAILLRCRFLHKGSGAGVIMSGEGPWGVWLEWTECSHGRNETFSFLTSFDLQTEPDQGGGDDTAANYVKFKCRNLTDDIGSSEYELALGNGEGMFGSYGRWSESCPSKTAICGMRVKIEGDQHGGDDTALNDVQFYCCE